MSILSAPYFHDEEAAYEFVEAHVWPKGRICPHCGVVDDSGKLAGKSTRLGVYKCYACRKPFTVKVGTIFESSHVKLHLWLQAIFLLVSSKKGISSNQLHRTLGVTLKTAWFMSHRIREAMRDGDVAPMGGAGSIVEIDETSFGKAKEPRVSKQRKGRRYTRVVSLAPAASAPSSPLPSVATQSARSRRECGQAHHQSHRGREHRARSAGPY